MTKSFRSRAAALAGLLTCVTWSLSAAAQYEPLETTRDGYEVHFEDGRVLADIDASNGFVLRMPEKPRRVLLIRPRQSFVGAMLESVEQM